VRNHSWSRPACATPEGEVVSWADRIAYVCHDFEDAIHAAVLTADALPAVVRERCGDRRSAWLRAFISGVVDGTVAAGRVAMHEDLAEALAAFRTLNYERIYLRPDSMTQSRAVIAVLQALVEQYARQPELLALDHPPGSSVALAASVAWVAGMTDRYACRTAVELLDWPPDDLPQGLSGHF
jgi:dGTPase